MPGSHSHCWVLQRWSFALLLCSIESNQLKLTCQVHVSAQSAVALQPSLAEKQSFQATAGCSPLRHEVGKSTKALGKRMPKH